MPAISGLSIPSDFYIITQPPAPLAGMVYPKPDFPWQSVFSAGFRHVVCLASSQPAYHPAPLNRLFSASLEDLYSRQIPQNPNHEELLIRQAVEAISGKLDNREGVIVHCVGGTGRTGTVLGCILRDLGFTTLEAVTYLNNLARLRGRLGWPESPWQAEFVARFE